MVIGVLACPLHFNECKFLLTLLYVPISEQAGSSGEVLYSSIYLNFETLACDVDIGAAATTTNARLASDCAPRLGQQNDSNIV